MTIYKTFYNSPLGPLTLESDDTHLLFLSFCNEADISLQAPTNPVLERTILWLDAYFTGNPTALENIPLSLKGTPFQRICWQELLRIPFGQTVTYGQLAKRVAAHMGAERMSSQAVGQAISKNPIAILIPCHRVVGADGRLTGYAWGLDIKKKLLAHETQKVL